MNDIDRIATERVLKARAELIMARRFYGVLVSNVEPVLSRKVETMATDSKRHYYNPDFIATLTQSQLLFVQAHESEHDARHHSTRRMGRDHLKWNEAGDYAINIDLVDEGIGEPPPWILLDAKYRGMSAEDIYRSRELDEQDQPQPQPQPQDGDDDQDDEQSSGDDQDGDDESDDQSSGDQDGDEAGDDASDQDDGGNEAGDARGDDQSDDGDDQGKGSGAGDDESSDQDTGNGGEADGDADGEGEAGEGEADDASDDQPGENGQPGNGNAPRSGGDPGRCGEVLDAADDVTDLAETDQQWERITRQAASIAKAVGQLPGYITREIERANNPSQDWREVLRAWFDQGALRTETWNRPNRRFIGQGLILPGSQRDGVNKAMFLVDTSGSMDEIALRCIGTEAQAALDDGVVDEVVVVYGDVRVTRVDTFRTGDEIEFDPRGGGGTDLRPLFKFVADEHDDASLIVCFTDLYIGDAGPEPHCPVLFAVTGYPDAVRELIAHAPWGAPGIDVGAH
jgi:predicted metal-dependent peptidase